MTATEDTKLDEVLALLQEQAERMTAIDARLSNLEVDQRLIREAVQEQGKTMGMILERCNRLCREPTKEVEEFLDEEDILDGTFVKL